MQVWCRVATSLVRSWIAGRSLVWFWVYQALPYAAKSCNLVQRSFISSITSKPGFLSYSYL